MNKTTRWLAVTPVALGLAVALGVVLDSPGTAAPKAGTRLLANVQQGNLKFKRIGRMSFGPNGVLLVADGGTGSVVAIETGDTGPVKKLKKRVDQVDRLVAASLGAKPGGVAIVDMAVNRASGLIYLSVLRQPGNQGAIVTIDADGRPGLLDLSKARHVRVKLPGGKAGVSNITGVRFAEDRVLAAGQSGSQFSSKIYSIPLPLTHGASADVYSAETYHVSHRRWETRAPIQSFVPIKENGKNYIVGSFSCTPIAKFPIDGLKSGAKVKGTSIVELGSGNRPIDMFTYRKGGRTWLVTNTDRFHHKQNPLGPSQYWGCRVDLKFLSAEKTNEQAAVRKIKQPKDPRGMEVIDVLFGVKQVDQLDNDQIVVLRDNKGALDLELAVLP